MKMTFKRHYKADPTCPLCEVAGCDRPAEYRTWVGVGTITFRYLCEAHRSENLTRRDSEPTMDRVGLRRGNFEGGAVDGGWREKPLSTSLPSIEMGIAKYKEWMKKYKVTISYDGVWVVHIPGRITYDHSDLLVALSGASGILPNDVP